MFSVCIIFYFVRALGNLFFVYLYKYAFEKTSSHIQIGKENCLRQNPLSMFILKVEICFLLP